MNLSFGAWKPVLRAPILRQLMNGLADLFPDRQDGIIAVRRNICWYGIQIGRHSISPSEINKHLLVETRYDLTNRSLPLALVIVLSRLSLSSSR